MTVKRKKTNVRPESSFNPGDLIMSSIIAAVFESTPVKKKNAW